MGLNWSLAGRLDDVDVTVVGSGPNGLAAAVICARAGFRCRCSRRNRLWVVVPAPCADPEFAGVAHDICSAVHPLALASPFFAEFDLPARGVTLMVPEISYANPLPGQPAAVGYRDLDRTCAELTTASRGVGCWAPSSNATARSQTASSATSVRSHRSDRRRPSGTTPPRPRHACLARL